MKNTIILRKIIRCPLHFMLIEWSGHWKSLLGTKRCPRIFCGILLIIHIFGNIFKIFAVILLILSIVVLVVQIFKERIKEMALLRLHGEPYIKIWLGLFFGINFHYKKDALIILFYFFEIIKF